MAKKVTKTVIEDIAYQLKRVGLITKAFEDGTANDELKANMGDDFDTSGTATTSWIITNIAEVLNEHDPTFDYNRFEQQTEFDPEM